MTANDPVAGLDGPSRTIIVEPAETPRPTRTPDPDPVTIRAGLRDASWYSYPRHDHGRASTWTPRYHVEDVVYGGTPVCAPNRVLLHDMCDAADVPTNMRCQRPACRARWPTL
jgi:hypothetical protein